MLGISSLAPAAYATPALRARAAAGGFGLALRGDAPEAPRCAASTESAAVLLMIQAETQDQPRRRRAPRDAAQHAVGLLRGLQRALLGPEGVSEAALGAAAEEAQALAAEAPDAEARRLCAAVALRLRVELAKRQPAGLA